MYMYEHFSAGATTNDDSGFKSFNFREESGLSEATLTVDPAGESLYGLVFSEGGGEDDRAGGRFVLSANRNRQLWMRLREDTDDREMEEEEEEVSVK